MSDYCEVPAWYITAEPVARKEHRCDECSAPILVGEKYLNVRACWDGQPCTQKQHLLCAEACMLVRDAGFNDDECLYYGQLDEWWREEVRYRNGVYPVPEMPRRRLLWRMMLRIYQREANPRRVFQTALTRN